MQFHVRPDIQIMDLVGPVLVATLYIAACSFFREPKRKNFQCDHDCRRERGPDIRWRGVAVGCPKSELTR